MILEIALGIFLGYCLIKLFELLDIDVFFKYIAYFIGLIVVVVIVFGFYIFVPSDSKEPVLIGFIFLIFSIYIAYNYDTNKFKNKNSEYKINDDEIKISTLNKKTSNSLINNIKVFDFFVSILFVFLLIVILNLLVKYTFSYFE